jgi:hypothetical protein
MPQWRWDRRSLASLTNVPPVGSAAHGSSSAAGLSAVLYQLAVLCLLKILCGLRVVGNLVTSAVRHYGALCSDRLTCTKARCSCVYGN